MAKITYEQIGIELNGARPTGMMELIREKLQEWVGVKDTFKDNLINMPVWNPNIADERTRFNGRADNGDDINDAGRHRTEIAGDGIGRKDLPTNGVSVGT
tara:strand:+ start:56 stop:355 length:300 start_codon:yes stop_codon:yes gene_type:complete